MLKKSMISTGILLATFLTLFSLLLFLSNDVVREEDKTSHVSTTVTEDQRNENNGEEDESSQLNENGDHPSENEAEAVNEEPLNEDKKAAIENTFRVITID